MDNQKPMMDMGFDPRKGMPMKGNPMMAEMEKDTEGDYEVQEGDTIESIAQQFGCTPEDIMAANNATPETMPTLLQPGKKIMVPVKGETE